MITFFFLQQCPRGRQGEHTQFNLKPTNYVCMFSLNAYIFLQERIIVFLGVRTYSPMISPLRPGNMKMEKKERKKGEQKRSNIKV